MSISGKYNFTLGLGYKYLTDRYIVAHGLKIHTKCDHSLGPLTVVRTNLRQNYTGNVDATF